MYRESDPSLPALSRDELQRVQELAQERAESSVSISPVKSVHSPVISPISSLGKSVSSTLSVSTISSSESVVLATILANHQHLFGGADTGGLSPFMTKIPNPRGELVSAMIIPFPECEKGHSETNQIHAYARTLGMMANAMATVGMLVTEQKKNGCYDSMFNTPIRNKREYSGDYSTPSPIIVRNMFT